MVANELKIKELPTNCFKCGIPLISLIYINIKRDVILHLQKKVKINEQNKQLTIKLY